VRLSLDDICICIQQLEQHYSLLPSVKDLMAVLVMTEVLSNLLDTVALGKVTGPAKAAPMQQSGH
jgi:hypothetical protein